MKMGKSLLWLGAFAMVVDGIALFGGTIIAYYLRFNSPVTEIIPIVTALPPFGWYFRLAIIFTILTLILLTSAGFYRFPRAESNLDDLFGVGKRFFVSFTLLLAGLFFYRGASFSRLTMTTLFLISGLGLILSRLLGRSIRVRLYQSGKVCRRAALVGTGGQVEGMIHRIKTHPEYGLKITGFIGSRPNSDGSHQIELPDLGSLENAGRIINDHSLDVLVISSSAQGIDPLPILARACYGVNVEFLYLPDLEGDRPLPRRVVDIGGVPLWLLRDVPFTGWEGMVKRTFDIIFSGGMLVVISPVMLLLALIVKMNSHGPIFYRQRRVGLDGAVFECIKFRSMRLDAESASGPIWASEGDSRVTSVGKFLRRWSLDELPQLWNIIKGDMSLVGPRPERPEFVKQFAERIEGYHERHRVRSGLTGWAQVNGLRGNVPIEERTQYDRHYVENWSLGLDLKILIMTFVAVIKGENSY